METYMRNIQSQNNNVYPSNQIELLHDPVEQYPLINFGSNNPMLGECLPNEEQLCNFISSLDGSTSLTFEKLLQSSQQDNEYRCNNYLLNPAKPSMYNFSRPESPKNNSFLQTSRPRMIRGCQDYRSDRWNSSLPQGPPYSPVSPAVDLNNNDMPCIDRNIDHNVFSPKRYECTEKQCQDFMSNQYYATKEVECDWNNNADAMPDLNNNACAVPEKTNETLELKIVSLLYHTKSLQTLPGKFHVLIDLSLRQLDLLTNERQKIEQSFSEVKSSVGSHQQEDLNRIDRLIHGYMNEVQPVKEIISKLDVVHSDNLKTDNRQLIDSWIGCIESVRLSRKTSSHLSQKEYLTQQVYNLKALCDQTRRIRTCIWCVSTLTTGASA
nr:PREDICTED: uncharacterized protein LOC109042884 [Bemisia tabaci]